MTSIWTAMSKMRNMSLSDFDVATYSPDAEIIITATNADDKTIGNLLDEIEASGHKEDVLLRCGQENHYTAYESTGENLYNCWGNLFAYGLVFAALSMISLEFIDKDKR